jgi:hypothetical protein
MIAEIEKPIAKRHWLKAIRGLLRSAIPAMLNDDPTAGISIKLPKSKGHRSWTDDEIEQYRAHWPLGTQQRLVMEFALKTTSRKGEVVRLGPQNLRLVIIVSNSAVKLICRSWLIATFNPPSSCVAE